MARKFQMKQVIKGLERNGAFKREAFSKVRKEFEKKKITLIESFNAHPVTKEIEAGPTASNESGTLGSYGNLYSFIGFIAGTTPTSQLRKILRKRTLLKKNPKISSRGSKMNIVYTIEIPSEAEITAVTPMPWEGGRSWAYGIERGISGLGFYVYKKWKTSRSGEAIQSQKKQRGGGFKQRGYLSEIWRDFTRRLR
tara:strand:+ start:548 stop:1135 length:588 start_codon:yes stop_codon:yes gene_type:complete